MSWCGGTEMFSDGAGLGTAVVVFGCEARPVYVKLSPTLSEPMRVEGPPLFLLVCSTTLSPRASVCAVEPSAVCAKQLLRGLGTSRRCSQRSPPVRCPAAYRPKTPAALGSSGGGGRGRYLTVAKPPELVTHGAVKACSGAVHYGLADAHVANTVTVLVARRAGVVKVDVVPELVRLEAEPEDVDVAVDRVTATHIRERCPFAPHVGGANHDVVKLETRPIQDPQCAVDHA
eukprot:2099229-Rhodomonas_salina.1